MPHRTHGDRDSRGPIVVVVVVIAVVVVGTGALSGPTKAERRDGYIVLGKGLLTLVLAR